MLKEYFFGIKDLYLPLRTYKELLFGCKSIGGLRVFDLWKVN
jgi:hypothetical protein